MEQFPDIYPAFGNWLAGFIAGEGSFSLMRKPRWACHACALYVELRGDDHEVLAEIHRRTGLGNLTRRPARGKSRPGSVWRVTSKAECLALVALFDAYPLRAKKARDFGIWREAVQVWCTEKPDQARLAELYDALKSVRRYTEQYALVAA